MYPQIAATTGSLVLAGIISLMAVACGAAAPADDPVRAPAIQATPDAVASPSLAEGNNGPDPASPGIGAVTNPSPAPAPTDTGNSSPGASPTVPAPTQATRPSPTPTRSSVVAELDWAEELQLAGINIGIWETDFSKRSVPYREIFSGGVPRDGIPPIDDPKFVDVATADGWLEAKEPVIALEIEGATKAYPLQILTWHEIVNDELAGVPVAATFCPLCNSAVVFDRRLDGQVYDFGVSGNLRNSDLIMWDRQTQSWWQQLTGEAIVGTLTGAQLDILPATITAWRDFKEAYPEAQVLSRDTGHRRNYGANPYVGYDEVGQSPFLFFGKEDDRLGATERVAAVALGDEAAAFTFTFLAANPVVNYAVGGEEVVVFFRPGARSALGGPSIAESREVGSTGVFLREVNGQTLTFHAQDGEYFDRETGTRWNVFGRGVEGEFAGSQLTPVPHANHFWFAWAAFRPDTVVVQELP